MGHVLEYNDAKTSNRRRRKRQYVVTMPIQCSLPMNGYECTVKTFLVSDFSSCMPRKTSVLAHGVFMYNATCDDKTVVSYILKYQFQTK